jgi:hypothetical protein
MGIKGSYKMLGSAGVGLKILVSGRELDESGNEKYPYWGYSGQEYYVATPGKKLEKINIPQYNPSIEGHVLYRFNPWGESYKFTSLSPYPRDWEFDIVFEIWKSDDFRIFIDWEKNLFSHNTGRGEHWSQFQDIDYVEGLHYFEQPNYNSYAQMSPIGKGQFVGPGLTGGIPYMEVDTNGDMISQLTNAPFCFYSKDDGFNQTDFNTNQSYSFTTATNTESFKFFSIGSPDHTANAWGDQINIAPKRYQLSKDVFLPAENYSLNGLRIIDGLGTFIISGSFSYVNYNAFDGLRNSTHAFVLKVTAQLGGRVGSTFPIMFSNQIDSQVLKIDLLSGDTEIICEYETTTMKQVPKSYFLAGGARIFLPSFPWFSAGEVQNIDVNPIDIDIDVLPKFMFAVFKNSKNCTLIGDIVYHVIEVIGLQNEEEILTKDYQLKIQKFNIKNLSSYEETVIQVEKSQQSDIPSKPKEILGIQYHPSFF